MQIIGWLLTGLLGYAAGVFPFRGFEEFVKRVRERANYLAYFKIIPPIKLFNILKASEIFYKEAVSAYLFGLPHASIAMSRKVLELGLKAHLGQDKLSDLIDRLLKDKTMKDLAHGLRIIANIVMHEDKTYAETDALEFLRHTSAILNRLHPFSRVQISLKCSQNHEFTSDVNAEDFYLGNIFRYQCPICKTIVPYVIGVEYGIPYP